MVGADIYPRSENEWNGSKEMLLVLNPEPMALGFALVCFIRQMHSWPQPHGLMVTALYARVTEHCQIPEELLQPVSLQLDTAFLTDGRLYPSSCIRSGTTFSARHFSLGSKIIHLSCEQNLNCHILVGFLGTLFLSWISPNCRASAPNDRKHHDRQSSIQSPPSSRRRPCPSSRLDVSLPFRPSSISSTKSNSQNPSGVKSGLCRAL